MHQSQWWQLSLQNCFTQIDVLHLRQFSKQHRKDKLIMVFYTLGTGHYLSSGGGENFCCDNGALTWSPLTVWFWLPHFDSGRFHDPPSSIPVITKSQGCYMQASDIYINTYVSRTLNDNLIYLVVGYELNCPWRHSLERLWGRVTLLIQIVENKFIVTVVLLTVEFFLISTSSFDSPSLSSLSPHDSTVFTDSLMCR